MPAVLRGDYEEELGLSDLALQQDCPAVFLRHDVCESATYDVVYTDQGFGSAMAPRQLFQFDLPQEFQDACLTSGPDNR
jgi:hypothetical protein